MYLEVVLALDELDLVETIAVREAAVVQESEQASVDRVDGSEHGNDNAHVLHLDRAQGCEDGAENELEDHEDPTKGSQEAVGEKIFGPLLDDVPVETIRHSLGGPVPAGGMDDRMGLAVANGSEAVSNPSPLGRGEKPMVNGRSGRLGARIHRRRRGFGRRRRGDSRRGCRRGTATGDRDGDARATLELVDALAAL